MSVLKDVENSIEYRIAKQYVDEFADDVIMKEHKHAMDCMDCEEWLNKGITAHLWITQVENTLRVASYEGLVVLTTEVKDAIETLYRLWLRPCAEADEWIDRVLANGRTPENLGEYRECKAKIIDQIQRQEWLKLGQKARKRRFAEEAW